MKLNPKAPYHHIYESNTSGRDFIVGDLQGCFDELMDALKKIDFDFNNDRLFAVGDLIDRGSKSFECGNLIYNKWFHSTMGNHELMMCRSLLHNDTSYHNMWINNGGLWHASESKWELTDLAESFSKLPLVISVGDGDNRFNIVHAELLRSVPPYSDEYLPVSDKDIDDWTFNNLDYNDMLWGRMLVDIRTPANSYKLRDINSKRRLQSDDLSLTYVGHSIMPGKPVQIERQIYIDTGMVNAYNEKNKNFISQCTLTIACPSEKMFYIYTLPWKSIIKHPYEKLKRYT